MTIENSQDYYGRVLESSADLRTDACCTLETPSTAFRAALANVHPAVKARYYGCGLVAPQMHRRHAHPRSRLRLGAGRLRAGADGRRRWRRGRRRRHAAAARGGRRASRLARRALRLRQRVVPRRRHRAPGRPAAGRRVVRRHRVELRHQPRRRQGRGVPRRAPAAEAGWRDVLLRRLRRPSPAGRLARRPRAARRVPRGRAVLGRLPGDRQGGGFRRSRASSTTVPSPSPMPRSPPRWRASPSSRQRGGCSSWRASTPNARTTGRRCASAGTPPAARSARVPTPSRSTSTT